MASASLQDLCEESICSICLEYLKDPVITECGHNFCRACLAIYWEGLEGKEISCPQCREKVQRKLIPNLQLGNFVELTKKLCLQKSPEGKGKACRKHEKPLKIFCKDDEAPICAACVKSMEHQDHQLVPLEKAAQDYQRLICSHLQFLEEERTKILIYKTEIEEKSQSLLYQTKAEIEKTKEQFREIQSFLDKQEKLFLARLEKVENETARKRDDLLDKLSEKLSSLGGLIQEMNQMCQKPPGELLQDARSILQSCEKKEPFQDLLAFRSAQSSEIIEVRARNQFLAGLMKQLKDRLSQPLQQKANFTLNPDTRNPYLILSEDGKSVNSIEIGSERVRNSCATEQRKFQQFLHRNPERFVLGYVGFTGGKRYWEVTVGKEGDWAVGVARKSVRRSGDVALSTKEGIWAIGKWDIGNSSQYRTSNPSDPSVSFQIENLRRIWVSLNCEVGKVTFCDGDTGSHLYTFSGAPFSGETLFPFFHVFKGASLTISP